MHDFDKEESNCSITCFSNEKIIDFGERSKPLQLNENL